MWSVIDQNIVMWRMTVHWCAWES